MASVHALAQLRLIEDTGARRGRTGSVRVFRLNIEAVQESEPLEDQAVLESELLEVEAVHQTEPLNEGSSAESCTKRCTKVHREPEYKPEEEEERASPSLEAPRAHRLSIDWQPRALTGLAAEAASGWGLERYQRELEKFRDHWAAASGRNAIKRDWDAAWRTWIVSDVLRPRRSRA
jgi:hypothetical protein